MILDRRRPARVHLAQCAHSSASVARAILVSEEKLESPPGLRSTGISLKSDVCKEISDCVSAVCRPIIQISLATIDITDTTAQTRPDRSAHNGFERSYQPTGEDPVSCEAVHRFGSR